MAKFKITDNVTGKTVTISGDTAPTEADAEAIFQQAGLRDQQVQKVQPQQYAQEALARNQALMSQPVPESPQTGGTLGAISQFLMPNVVKYGQTALQNIGQGNLTQQKTGTDILMSALGPGAQQIAGMTGLTSPAESQKNLGAREAAQTLQLVKMLASGGSGLVNEGVKRTQAAIATKSLNPKAISGYLRSQAADKAGNLSTKALLKAGDNFVANNPLAKEVWDTFKPTIGEKMPAKKLLEKMVDVFGQAYTKGGDVRSTAEAGLLNKLYGAGQQVFREQAPEVMKYTKELRQAINAPKDIQKVATLLAKIGLFKQAF